MKKIIIGITLILLICTKGVYAADSNAFVDDVYNKIDLYKLEMYTNNETFHSMFGYSDIKTFIKDCLSGNFEMDFDAFFTYIKNTFFNIFKSNLSLIGTVVVLSVMCSLINVLNSSFMSEEISEIAFYGVFIVLISVILKTFVSIINISKELITTIVTFMNVLFPIILSLMYISGQIVSSSAISPSLVFIINAFSSVMVYFVIPVLSFGYVMLIANNLFKDIDFNYLIKFIKQSVTFVISGFALLFSGFVSLEGRLFSSVDRVSVHTLKFAVSKLVPVIGGFLSDSADTVIGFVSVIRSSIGVISTFILLALLISPLLNMFVNIVCFKISAILVEPITDKRISKTLNDTASFLTLFFISFIVCLVMFIFLIGVVTMIGGIR